MSMLGDIAQELEYIRTTPGAPDSLERGRVLLSHLETAPLDDAVLEQLADSAVTWVCIGLGSELRELLDRARDRGCRSPALRRASLACEITLSPAAAAGHLRGHSSGDLALEAIEVCNRLYRGQLLSCIQLATHHDWFLDHPELMRASYHAIWAAALSGRTPEARRVLAEWERSAHELDDRGVLFLLRSFGIVASQELRYLDAIRVQEEALSMAERLGDGLASVHLEAFLAVNRARFGDVDRALSTVAGWTWDGVCHSRIDAIRARASAEVHVLAGDIRGAESAAVLAATFFAETGDMPMRADATFWAALANASEPSNELLLAATTAARASGSKFFVDRIQQLRRLIADTPPPSPLPVTARRHRRSDRQPLARLWTPTTEALEAELLWNRVTDAFWRGGKKWRDIDNHPVLRRLLEVVLDSPQYTVAVPELLERVWQTRDLVANEGKLHVTIHRLRKLLGNASDGGALVHYTKNAVSIPRSVTMVVLELAPLSAT